MLKELKGGARGFGSSRFLVDGSNYYPLPLARALRPRYNEYPERFPLDPSYPLPGRRGGSRAPSHTGGAGGGAEGGGVIIAPPSSLWPDPRDRGDGDIPTGGSLPQPGDADASSINRCAGEGGIHIQFAGNVAAATTDRKITTRFSRPFIIRHVQVWSDTSDVTASHFRIRIVNNNDTSAGADADGIQLDEGAIGQADFGLLNFPQNSFPNKRVTNVPAYIKIITVNGTAGVIVLQVIINIEWLD